MMSKTKEVVITESQKQRLKIVQDKFYALLKSHGFSDIEDSRLPDRPLKEWHNMKFSSEKAKAKIAIRAEYQKLIDDFTNSPSFEEVCRMMIYHGNCKVGIEGIREIWELSAHQAWTERRIAEHVGRSKTCIHYILKRFRAWMILV